MFSYVWTQNNSYHGQVFISGAMSQAVCHALLLFELSPDLAFKSQLVLIT